MMMTFTADEFCLLHLLDVCNFVYVAVLCWCKTFS